jgi:prepilin-type N-terminal cleavage/methylation domain-containing protein
MQKKSVSGFTLVEMMIVIALIGIIAAIAAPNFFAYRENTNLKEAARDISSDILYWKQRAVSDSAAYRINFNASSSYTIQQVIGSVVTDLATKNISPGNASIAINGTPSFMPGGVTYVTLNARGTSTNGSIKLIHNKRLSEATITVNIMGRVKVEYALK